MELNNLVPVDGVDPITIVLSTGDETENGPDAIEQGEQFDNEPLTSKPVNLSTDNRLQLRRQQVYYKDTQKSIADAVQRLIGDVQLRTTSQPLGIADLLRLRVLLMVVLGAGSNKAVLLPTDPNAKISRRQVLPSQGEFGWPQLAGRLLFAFFRAHGGTPGPLVEKLAVVAEGNAGIPDDVLECWATCFWAACAMHVAFDDKKQSLKLSRNKQEADEDLYRGTRVVRQEALGERITECFSGLNLRFAERLGALPADIEARHRALVEGTMAPGAIPVVA